MSSLLIILAGVLWGCIGLFVRPLNGKGLSSMEIVTLRAIVTTLGMFVYLLIINRKALKIRLKDFWCFLGTGICSILFFNYCYFKCISMTSLAAAAILLYTAPAIVMVLSRFLFKERFTKLRVLALVMTFVGCVLVTGVTGGNAGLTVGGVLVGLGSGLGYALYSIFSRYALERGYTSMTITFYTFLIAGIGSLFLTDPGRILGIAAASPSNLLLACAFGLACTVIPYLAYTKGLQGVDNGQASILASIEPVTAALMGILIFHEQMTASGLIGSVMVIVALVLCGRA